jgi:hypothetical protein
VQVNNLKRVVYCATVRRTLRRKRTLVFYNSTRRLTAMCERCAAFEARQLQRGQQWVCKSDKRNKAQWCDLKRGHMAFASRPRNDGAQRYNISTSYDALRLRRRRTSEGKRRGSMPKLVSGIVCEFIIVFYFMLYIYGEGARQRTNESPLMCFCAIPRRIRYVHSAHTQTKKARQRAKVSFPIRLESTPKRICLIKTMGDHCQSTH